MSNKKVKNLIDGLQDYNKAVSIITQAQRKLENIFGYRVELKMIKFVDDKIYSHNSIRKEVQEIIDQFEIFAGIPQGSIQSQNRSRVITDIRRMAMKYLRTELLMTCVDIGKCMNRDHSSVVVDNKRFDELYLIENDFRELYNRIKQAIGDSKKLPELKQININVYDAKN